MKYFPEYSNFVKGVDFAFLFILAISFLFLIGLTATVIIFIVKYNRTKHPEAVQMNDNFTLEIVWTVIPLVLVLFMFYYGYIGYMPMRNAPAESFLVKAEGRMWDFEFTYPNGKKSKDLFIPVNKPVKVLLYSKDVIHGFYIPAFRVKEDMVPGKENFVWFVANQVGAYEILCTVYCGLRHSMMESKTNVMEDADFEKWLADFTPPDKNQDQSLTLLNDNSCLGCHSTDGSVLVGPSFKGLYGSDRKVIVNGSVTVVKGDESYLREAIMDPDAKIADGFSEGIMQPYKDVLTEKDVELIIKYLKELK